MCNSSEKKFSAKKLWEIYENLFVLEVLLFGSCCSNHGLDKQYRLLPMLYFLTSKQVEIHNRPELRPVLSGLVLIEVGIGTVGRR